MLASAKKKKQSCKRSVQQPRLQSDWWLQTLQRVNFLLETLSQTVSHYIYVSGGGWWWWALHSPQALELGACRTSDITGCRNEAYYVLCTSEAEAILCYSHLHILLFLRVELKCLKSDHQPLQIKSGCMTTQYYQLYCSSIVSSAVCVMCRGNLIHLTH